MSNAREFANLADSFEGYLTPTDQNYKDILNSGVVVLDANVLLNLYRYAPATREDLLAVLEKLGERLWIPHQVAHEFWKNRENALGDLKKVTKEAVTTLNDLSSQASEALASWANRISLNEERRDRVSAPIKEGFESAVKSINDLGDLEGKNGHWDTNKDQLLASVEALLTGKVGNRLTEIEEASARKEAERRIAANEPPGFKDAKKDDPCGDYLFWLQTLQEARRREVDLLIVTDDSRSDDWYRRQGGKTRGPRLELIHEMREFSNSRLYMMRTQSLLYHAGRALQVDVRPSSVEEAAQLSEQSSLTSKEATLSSTEAAERLRKLDDEMREEILQNQKSAERRNRLLDKTYEVQEKYEEHLENMGFYLSKPEPSAWTTLAHRSDTVLRFCFLNEDYGTRATLMKIRLPALLEDLTKHHSNDGVVFPVTPSEEVLEIFHHYGFGVVWPMFDEWKGNTEAIKAGMVL
ncbi:PIN-like domain-containing protein [Amycolatopsis sp. cmx-11-51]|uniref:PIN-like domain-containing protein n=1 Tax=Amycolatopsis sp. cmx-11-51 TaxID=2785797 RepID=UPI0039E2E8A8